MNTTPGDALPMDPRILQDSVARLRSGAPASGTVRPVLVSRAADPKFRRPVPAPVLLAAPGVRPVRPVLIPANLAALTRRLPRAAAPTDPAPDTGS